MWSQKQKAWLHQVKSVAGIAEIEYRAQLKALTGCDSAADDRLTNTHFEKVMCWLEMEICRAIADQIVTPDEVFDNMQDPWSFHKRKHQNQGNFKGNSAKSNVKNHGDAPTEKQLALIDATRKDLCAYERQYSQWDYIKSIIHNGMFGPAPECAEDLTREQASKLINALKERHERYKSSEIILRDPVKNILNAAEVEYQPKDEPLPF